MTVKFDAIRSTAEKYNQAVFKPNSRKICSGFIKEMACYYNQYNELHFNWLAVWDRLIIDSIEFKGEEIYRFDSYLGLVFLDNGFKRVKLGLFCIDDFMLDYTINNFEFAFYVDEAIIKYHGAQARYTFRIIKGGEEIYRATENAEDVWQSLKEYELF